MDGEFLRWLGGYFDHGGYCDVKTYPRITKHKLADGTIKEYKTQSVDAQIQFSGTLETVKLIREKYPGWKAKIHEENPNSSRHGWRLIFRGTAGCSRSRVRPYPIYP